MTKYREKTCMECGRVYRRQFRRNTGTMGWCRPSCYFRDYRRRRRAAEAGAAGARAGSPQKDYSQGATMAEKEMNGEIEETVEMCLDVVADRPLVPHTRFEEDNGVGVEWRGRCWAWPTDGEAPVLRDVVVTDAEVVKLLEPGSVRRVRAIERPVETPEGTVDGLALWMEFAGQCEPDRRATVRGLREGEKVRISENGLRQEINGSVGTLLWFTVGTIDVDGRRYGVGLKDLEPVDGPSHPPTGAREAESASSLQDAGSILRSIERPEGDATPPREVECRSTSTPTP